MGAHLARMEADDDPRRYFLAAYRRTTIAVRGALLAGRFYDPCWVECWDVGFAGLYVDAIEQSDAGARAPSPWARTFDAARQGGLPPLRHVLLGMNAHINFDLPQALLAAITDAEFGDRRLLAQRRHDHEQIDAILTARVDAEDHELRRVERPGDRTSLDRLMTPFNQAATKRFLRESRRKVWVNAMLLSAARRSGPAALRSRLGQLEELSHQRVVELCSPGQILLKLAIRGFGVELPAVKPHQC